MNVLIQEYLSWIATTGESIADRRLPVFWINGRSGDGKSVLLLQLAASILDSHPDSVLYQLGLPDDLPQIVDHLQNTQGAEGFVLIVVDDLDQIDDPRAFDAAIKLALDAERFNVAVLTCGPTPEMEELSRIPKEDYFRWFSQLWTDVPGASTRNHPAPFPIEIPRRLILMFSFLGDIILDPFVGSGTTLDAAVQLGRNAVALDIEESYVAMASSRLKESSRLTRSY